MTIDEMPEVLTAKMIAEHLHLTNTRIYELMSISTDAGGIPSFRVGRSPRVHRDKYLAWVASRETNEAPVQSLTLVRRAK